MKTAPPDAGGKSRFFRPRRILVKSAIYSWILVIATLVLYLACTLPYQKRVFIDNLESEARNIAASISQVTAAAIVAEDYSSSIDHCMKVLTDSDSLRYVVITRQDGFSLVHTKTGWKQEMLGGIWVPSAAQPEGKIPPKRARAKGGLPLRPPVPVLRDRLGMDPHRLFREEVTIASCGRSTSGPCCFSASASS